MEDSMDKATDSYIREIIKELEEENLAVFCGAGLSVPAGFVTWKGLMKPIADELNLDIDKEEHDLISLAQYHCNVNALNRSKLNQRLIDEFSRDAVPSENHRILARLPISTFWTTNYDRLIESSLVESGKRPDVKYRKEQLAFTKPKRDAIVYKMHGDMEHPDQAVLTKDDYESYHVKMDQFLTALAGDLVSKTFLFIGFSFSDPNLDYILSRVRVAYTVNQRRHYCFVRKVKENECADADDFEYKKRKHELFIGDLSRFNIKALIIDDYSQVTEILQGIENRYKRKNIFISGAAHEFGPWGENRALSFIHELSKSLIKEQFKIVSGFGLGVGSAVISGALEEIYMNPANSKSDQLILRPFPQQVYGTHPKEAVWKRYRDDMCSHAGIALFIFGNKLADGEVVPSNGMREEFEIAKSKGVFLLPIGATGYVAKTLWEEVKNSFYTLYPGMDPTIKDKFLLLGDEMKTPGEILNIVLSILKELIE
jgi:hypothetical protein